MSRYVVELEWKPRWWEFDNIHPIRAKVYDHNEVILKMWFRDRHHGSGEALSFKEILHNVKRELKPVVERMGVKAQLPITTVVELDD